MAEEIPNLLSETFSKLSCILFRCKEALSYNDSFELKTIRKNLVTKIYCEGSIFSKPVIFLFSVSFFNTDEMVEVVKAGLESIHKTVKTNASIDESKVDEIRNFILSSHIINVRIIENSISLTSSNQELNIFIINADDAAKYLLVRSLCVFLAICGKTVTNNIDDIKLNDYGRVIEV